MGVSHNKLKLNRPNFGVHIKLAFPSSNTPSFVDADIIIFMSDSNRIPYG